MEKDHIVKIRKVIRNVFKHQLSKVQVKRLLKNREEIFLEVGAGDRKGRGGWTTLDITKKCDIFWDIRRGLPFPDGSVSKIYSSHFLEHLSFKEIQVFLNESRRVLATDGTFSICVPNARIFIEAYLDSTTLVDSSYMKYAPALNHTGRIDYVNYIAYMNGEHKYMFDAENLIHVLTANGFRNACTRPFDPDLDIKERDLVSIYAEAEK